MSLILITTQRFRDDRGWFTESWNAARWSDWGLTATWCQDNHSYSAAAGTLRGLHYQTGAHAQTKLVRCIRGAVYDVAVDLRPQSPAFKQWRGFDLSAENGAQLLIPRGYAHGFLTLTPDCEVTYKVDRHYAPEADGGVAWDDPEINVIWPLPNGITTPQLSTKDAALPKLSAAMPNFPYDGERLDVREIVQ
jgi:dTDP-4-dehydrorhamnose 3,5-epimerase